MADTTGLYRRYLKAADLPEEGVNLKIKRATIETVRPRPAKEERVAILWFNDRNGGDVAFVLNQGNYNQIVRLAGGEKDTDKWVGVMVRLTPGTWGISRTVYLTAPKANGGNNA